MTDLQTPQYPQQGPGPAPYGTQFSGPVPQHQPYPGMPMDPAQAAAYAKAAKAHAKKMRPWFKKKRFVIPLSLAGLAIVSNVINGGNSTTPTATAPAAQAVDTGTAAQQPAASTKKTADKKSTDTKAAEKPAATDTKEQPAVNAPGIGTAVTSGDFKITITKVRTGVASVGGEYVNEKADGRFVLVDLKATNQGNEAHYITGDDLKLKDAQGREFSVDSVASIYVSENNPLLEEINPGNTSKGTLAFDLPKGVKPTQVEISAGGLFSEPTVVQLAN